MRTDLAGEEAELIARRQPYVRVTVVWSDSPVSAKAGDAAIVTADGRLRGWVGGSCSEPVVVRQALLAAAEATPRLVRMEPPGEHPGGGQQRPGVVTAAVTCASGGSLEVFVEPRVPPPHLIIVGRSPLVRALAAMAPAIGFEVAVVERDDVDPAEFGSARVIGELDLAKAGAGPDSFIVVATMGRYDEDAVEAALATGACYVAVVASARRGAALCDTLRRTGVPGDDLERLRAPAGLDLGALPHPEIAVAVLADIVAEKAAASSATTAARERLAAPAAPSVTAPAQLPAEAVDPVCGMTVDIARAADTAAHDGVRYWFCAGGCRRRFEAEPQRFVAP
ncbi:MAG: XdhC family protein [Actinomycetota bacterium]|nr:XdhC family protein [Actinomycetota bacterium]